MRRYFFVLVEREYRHADFVVLNESFADNLTVLIFDEILESERMLLLDILIHII